MDENWELKAIRLQLREILKQKKISYAALGKKMKVSEITVKRFFTTRDISFCKLQMICEAIGISALELISLVNRGNEQSFQLTESEELYLSKNEQLYNFFVLLLKTRSVRNTVLKGRFESANIPKFLRELKSLDLIDLPFGDIVNVKRSGTLTWRKNGPLQKKLMHLRHEKYLDAFEKQLDDPSNFLTSSQRHLRPDSVRELIRDLEFVAQKFRDRAHREETTCSDSQLVSVAWLFGFGQCDPA